MVGLPLKFTGLSASWGDSMSEEANIPDIFRAYEEGKHRRYNLLFAVNGGAFAVVELFATLTESPTILDPTDPVLGSLTLSQLSLGMALFTIVMVVDIFMFGEKMRKQAPALDLFAWQGKIVLILIGLLIAAGWAWASFGGSWYTLVILLGYGGIIVIVHHLPKIEKKIREIWSSAG
jgi:hypothetical protein